MPATYLRLDAGSVAEQLRKRFNSKFCGWCASLVNFDIVYSVGKHMKLATARLAEVYRR